jgi:hypothetical protein
LLVDEALGHTAILNQVFNLVAKTMLRIQRDGSARKEFKDNQK